MPYKTLEEKIEVMKAALAGKLIKVSSRSLSSRVSIMEGKHCNFNWEGCDYDVHEEPKTKPSIDWPAVSKEFNYMATDEDGLSYLYSQPPSRGYDQWMVASGQWADAQAFSSFISGTCDWQDSLVERPKDE